MRGKYCPLIQRPQVLQLLLKLPQLLLMGLKYQLSLSQLNTQLSHLTMIGQFSARCLSLQFLIKVYLKSSGSLRVLYHNLGACMSALFKDGRIWKEQVSSGVQRRTDLPVMQEGAPIESETAGTEPRSRSNRLILPSISAPEHNILKLLEECNASGI